tara:strand:- start:419 stop:3655 length:3237 start_codon:yes stop_codon:yes gene_type:complete
MPSVFTAIASVVNFFVAVFSYATGSYIAGTVLGYVAAGVFFNAVGGQLGKLYQIPEIGLAQQGASMLSNTPSSTAPIPVIYGARRVGGTRVFVGSSPGYNVGEANTENYFLNIVLALCEGPVGSVEAVYLNNVQAWPIPDSRFNGKVKINVHLGNGSQIVDQDLFDVANAKGKPFEWTTDHRLQGVAYLYVRLESDQEVWASGTPTISADVKGAIVADPRVNIADGNTRMDRWSNNPALCIRDYLTNTTYGRGISESDIDDTSISASANYCDERITITKDDGTTFTQKRYTMNGVVTIGETSMAIIEKLLTSCRGSLVFSGGKYKLILDKAESPVLTFNESNVLPNFNITMPGKESLANRVTANYFNPAREWQADFVYSESSVFKTKDDGLLLDRKIELPFTADYYMSNYIAEQTLKQSRQGMIVDFSTTQAGLLAEIGDVIYMDLESPGWSTLNSGAGKKFRVIQMSIGAEGEIKIVAREYDADVYVHGSIKTFDTAPNTALPSLADIKAPPINPGITITEELLFNDPKITNRINLSWNAPEGSFIKNYEIAFQSAKDNKPFIQSGVSTGRQYNVENLDPGVYQFAVRSTNNAGFKSEYITKTFVVKGVSVLPAINPPAISGVVESLITTTLGSGVKAKAVLSWVAIANSQWEALGVNIESYEVEYKLASTSANFERLGSSTGTFFEFFDIAPGSYNFRVRAVNDAGIKSDYAEVTSEITGLSAKPANVANFYMRAESTQANLSWTPTTDLDVKVGGTFEIRHSVVTSNAAWGVAIKIGSDVPGSSNSASMPLLVGTYLIKAVDSTGNKSASATTIVNTVSPSMFDTRTQATVTDTAFAGTKSNMVIDSDTGFLKFEADTLWDAVPGNIDEWTLIDSIGGADTSGYYLLNNTIDIGKVYNVNLRSSIAFNAVSTSDIWDQRLGNLDTWEAVDANTFDDLNATMFIATTNNDPASGSATWSAYQEFTIGNYYGRGFKFKLQASSGDPTHQINITQIQASAEVYFRFESETGTTATGGTTFTYDNSFLSPPAIAITANDMATGDYYAITNASATAFTLRFYNASGSGIQRTAYYLARGH